MCGHQDDLGCTWPPRPSASACLRPAAEVEEIRRARAAMSEVERLRTEAPEYKRRWQEAEQRLGTLAEGSGGGRTVLEVEWHKTRQAQEDWAAEHAEVERLERRVVMMEAYLHRVLDWYEGAELPGEIVAKRLLFDQDLRYTHADGFTWQGIHAKP